MSSLLHEPVKLNLVPLMKKSTIVNCLNFSIFLPRREKKLFINNINLWSCYCIPTMIKKEETKRKEGEEAMKANIKLRQG